MELTVVYSIPTVVVVCEYQNARWLMFSCDDDDDDDDVDDVFVDCRSSEQQSQNK